MKHICEYTDYTGIRCNDSLIDRNFVYGADTICGAPAIATLPTHPSGQIFLCLSHYDILSQIIDEVKKGLY